MRRVLLVAAALTIPVSGLVVGLSSPASAKKAAKITCTSLGGGVASITISGCTGGDTGGGTKAFSGTVLANGGTITWLSGKTTTFGKPTLKSTSTKKCPPSVNASADKASVPVTNDSGTGVKVPGTAKGTICINSGDSEVQNIGKFTIT